VVKRLADDIQWATDLGNAFLAQQSDVMDAVQRMRKKAQDKGNLKSTEQQRVETKVIESKSVIVVEQANPQVVYVPSYDPVVVYGPASILILLFTIRRPDIMPAVWRSRLALASLWGRSGAGVGTGDAVGAATTSTSTGTIISTATRTLVAATATTSAVGTDHRISRLAAMANRASTQPVRGGGDRGGNSDRWQHKPEHRGGAPYRDRATANRFGGTTRGDSLSNRQAMPATGWPAGR